MADKFPSTFVDEKSGAITTFQTLREKVQGEYLPEAGHVGILGIKLAVLAPFVGGPLLAVAGAAAIFGAGRWAVTKALDLMHEKLLLQHKKGDFIEFDFTDAKDVAAFQRKFGKEHPNFVDEYLHLAKSAKLQQVPKVFVIDQYFKSQGRSKLGGLVSDYMAGTTTRPSGKDPVIMLGKGALKDLNEGELRAVVAHEMTHLALEHPAKGVKWLSRMPLNSAVNIGLIAAAILGPLPLLPVIGLVAGGNLIGRALKSIKSRHQEEMCDRGAALMTGGTDDLSTALGKIKRAMIKMNSLEVEYQYRSQGLDPPPPQEVSKVTQFVNGSHPSNERRNKLLDNFEEKHHGYAEKKRNFFTETFNKAAAKIAPAIKGLVSGAAPKINPGMAA